MLFRPFFLGKEPQFGERVRRDHISPEFTESHFWTNYGLFFEREKECIEKEIIRRITIEGNKEPEVLWREIEDKIKNIYISKEDPIFLEKIKNNEFSKRVPKYKEIVIWKLLFIFSILFETLVLVFQSIFGGEFNPVIVIYGFLLGLGGFFLGEVLGDYMFYYEFARLGEAKARHLPNTVKIIIMGLVGLMLILFVAYLRSLGTDEINEKVSIIGLTILLGLAVAVVDAIKRKLIRMRDYYIEEQERGLQMMASKLHSEYIENYKRFFNDKWNELKTNKMGVTHA